MAPIVLLDAASKLGEVERAGSGPRRRIDWRAASFGLVAAVVLQLAASWLTGSRPFDRVIVTFGFLVVAGFLTGWLGPAAGGLNGTVVAIGFIVVTALAAGSGDDMVRLIVGDLVTLSGGTLGGWLGGRARWIFKR